jgi:hypothetical protein
VESAGSLVADFNGLGAPAAPKSPTILSPLEFTWEALKRPIEFITNNTGRLLSATGMADRP